MLVEVADAAVVEAALSFAGSGSASGVDEAAAGVVEVELTNIGGSGSLILDGEEGTDVGVLARAAQMNSQDLRMERVPLLEKFLGVALSVFGAARSRRKNDFG